MPQPPAGARDIAATTGSPANRWRESVIHQVSPRGFADGKGDGMGDLPVVRSRLSYLKELGVDALWLNPFYASPQADAGYDIADHRAVEPTLGTLLDAEELIRHAHGPALRIIVDLVPSHSCDQHEWFLRAPEEGTGSALRERHHFHPGARCRRRRRMDRRVCGRPRLPPPGLRLYDEHHR